MATGAQRALADRLSPIECMMHNERAAETADRKNIWDFNPFRERDEYEG